MIKVWSGYRAAYISEYIEVSFRGERLGAVTREKNGRAVERTFYATADGRIVVHEIRYGLGTTDENVHDAGNVYVFDTLESARERFHADIACIEAFPGCRADPTRVEMPNAPEVTLDALCDALKDAPYPELCWRGALGALALYETEMATLLDAIKQRA